MDVLANLLSFCSELKELECHSIRPPQEVLCVYMYSVVRNALVYYTNHYLTVLIMTIDPIDMVTGI